MGDSYGDRPDRNHRNSKYSTAAVWVADAVTSSENAYVEFNIPMLRTDIVGIQTLSCSIVDLDDDFSLRYQDQLDP